MNQLYPIIRRVRRPLFLAVEQPAAAVPPASVAMEPVHPAQESAPVAPAKPKKSHDQQISN